MSTTRRQAFTLTELLVVMSILVMLMVLAVPNLKAVLNSENIATGANTVSQTLSHSRAFATLGATFASGQFAGSAIIFTPTGKLILVQHTESRMLRDGSNAPLNENYHGFTRVTEKDNALPRNIGVMGITLTTGDKLELLLPPFAIRFTPEGMLYVRKGGTLMDERTLFDGSFDGKITVGTERSNTYKPFEWDPEHPKYATNATTGTNDPAVSGKQFVENYHIDRRKDVLPFETLENAVGLFVYDKAEFYAAGFDITDPSFVEGGGEADWILEHGFPIYFNRYTGAIIKP